MTSGPDWATAVPMPRLAPFIDRYIGYRTAGTGPAVHRGLPSGHMTFIVGIGGTIDLLSPTDPGETLASYGSVLSGLHAGPVQIADVGQHEGVAIELTPLGARTLFGMPARALWSTTVECADVAGPAGAELWERLQHATGWTERFAACDAVLGRMADPGITVSPQLGAVWRALVRSGGTVPVDSLADRVGWSRQHLTRRFRDEFGPAPKLAARVVRFDRARHLLTAARPGPATTIADVAACCGYYDQAHLSHDFGEFAGCPPGTLVAELTGSAGPG